MSLLGKRCFGLQLDPKEKIPSKRFNFVSDEEVSKSALGFVPANTHKLVGSQHFQLLERREK